MGKIYNKSSGGSPIGRVENGKVYNKSYGGSPIGRVENGKVYNKSSGGNPIGRVDGAHPNSGGAALLLLLTWSKIFFLLRSFFGIKDVGILEVFQPFKSLNFRF